MIPNIGCEDRKPPRNGGKTRRFPLEFPCRCSSSYNEVDKPPPVDGRMEEILHQLVNGLSMFIPL